MAKVSKNIKKLRNERKLTQDSLAEKINVTRQTVSSWENDRTQPDIEMLGVLADVFGVSLEEIIYGEKRNVGLEATKKDNRRAMNIVFATLGTLLTITGIVIVFAYFWSEIPEALLAALMFLPLIAGSAVAFYAYSKKKDSVSWCEGACVTWTAGLAITNALVNANFGADLGFEKLLIIDALLILPMAFVLNSVFPLTAYFACICTWNFLTAAEYAAALIPLFAAGVLFVFKSKGYDMKHKYSVWVSVISAAFLVISSLCITSQQPLVVMFYMLLAVFTLLYAADKNGDSPYPFRFFAVPCITVINAVLCVTTEMLLDEYKQDGYAVLPFVVSIIIIALAFFISRKDLGKNPIKTAFLSVTALTSFVLSGSSVLENFSGGEELQTVISLLSLASSIILIISGIRNAKMLTVNLGLIMICYIIFVTLIMGNWDLVYSGIACVVMGIALLLINRKLSKSFKAREAENNA